MYTVHVHLHVHVGTCKAILFSKFTYAAPVHVHVHVHVGKAHTHFCSIRHV